MGSGKSTIGRQLAKKLGRPFFDSDKEIEDKTGVNISLIFEIEGEEGFRAREAKMLAELAQNNESVIATGGGIVLLEENRHYLRENGRVVYLRSSAEKLFERTRKDKNRPLLNTDDRLSTIKSLMEERKDLYEGLADIIVDTEEQSIRKILEQITEHLELE